MGQKVSPVVGVVIAVLVVAVIGLAYMAMGKSGPPPSLPMGAPGSSSQPMALPLMDQTPKGLGAGAGSTTTPNAGGMSLPGGPGARMMGGMPGAPKPP